ncbi:hypothetical protein EV361DRAFT_386326 [Lentinula raphanica]|nr:hypothetical protein EV361DRAFT_386326 [Lentinula raphanica]
MPLGLARTTRSGRVFLEIIAENDSNNMAIFQVNSAVNLDIIAKESIEDLDDPDLFISKPASLKRKLNPEAESKTSSQSANNIRLAKRRAEEMAVLGPNSGHPSEEVLNKEPIRTALVSEELPIAEGGWVASDCSYVGAKKKHSLEELQSKKDFTRVPWKGKDTVCAIDAENRVVLVAVGKPDDPTYSCDAENMTNLMLEIGANTDWTKDELNSRRGKFASATCGWSHGNGQPHPMRLGGERQELMEAFVSNKCVERVAAHQSDSFARYFPKAHEEYRGRNEQLKERIPEFDGNIKGSVFNGCTANFGPNTWTYIHRDTRNAPGACAITAGGNFDSTKGGQLIVWDLRFIFDFPAGSTILLPSALFRHSNIPVRDGEQRVSFTQYTAGGIHRWLEYGGRTKEAFEIEDPEGYSKMLEEREGRWRKALEVFSTYDELKASGVVGSTTGTR